MASEPAPFVAQVIWPNAPLTDSLVRNALLHLHPECQIVSSATSGSSLQWSSYDEIDHELVNTRRESVLSSSYTFRKCLIRKHFLSRCISSFLTKKPESLLKDAWPRTFEIEISFADELDEIFADELWELGEELENNQKWWILKPLNRGNGIRLFNDRATLEGIFEEFEESDDDDVHENDEDSATGIVTSQLRHFVIQEYLACPLLLDPSEIPLNDDTKPKPEALRGHKFHLRAYCVASGALSLYLYTRVLALFSALPYQDPASELGNIDLARHLTNTCLQVSDRGEEGVRLLDELAGCRILSGSGDAVFTEDDIGDLKDQMKNILAETFAAALRDPVNFQPLPNAFELFGVDFMVTHSPDPQKKFQVNLLEINAEPAIEMTGPRLRWILEGLFTTIASTCVEPFFQKSKEEQWDVGQERQNFLKCLEQQVRGK
ncbi:putative tubulin--tyrosine ligase pby1 [Paramarasmius palmivorus]|uniref:Tubulin--tyrosine ligase pby1 n=1 Tax=Paramarasmius palmivorus TaxID=297713 RepID=A0AAW0E6I0_9AGAR